MTPERITKALEELVAQGDAVLATEQVTQLGGRVDHMAATEWAMSVIALLRSTFGAGSDHYQSIRGHRSIGDASDAKRVQATLRSALNSWKNGYLFDIRDLVRADVESDLLGQASDLLSMNYDRAAAVVAGAVLEEHMRAIADSWGVATHGQNGKPLTLEPLNVELKKAGAYDGLMQKRITTVGALRNEAAHGQAQPFDNRSSDVRRMIEDVTDICDRVAGK